MMARFFTSCVKSLQIHIISQQKVTKHNLPAKLVNCLGKVNLLTHILYVFLLIITQPSFQEETNYKMAWDFSSSSNRPLLFKAHACTGRISHDRFPANLLV